MLFTSKLIKQKVHNVILLIPTPCGLKLDCISNVIQYKYCVTISHKKKKERANGGCLGSRRR